MKTESTSTLASTLGYVYDLWIEIALSAKTVRTHGSQRAQDQPVVSTAAGISLHMSRVTHKMSEYVGVSPCESLVRNVNLLGLNAHIGYKQ